MYHKKLSLLNDNYKLSNAIEYCVYFFGIVSDLLPVLFILKILNYVTLDSYFSDSGHSGRHIWLYRYCCKCCGYCKSIVLHFYCSLPAVINTWKKIYRMMNKCVECCFCGKIYTLCIDKKEEAEPLLFLKSNLLFHSYMILYLHNIFYNIYRFIYIKITLYIL